MKQNIFIALFALLTVNFSVLADEVTTAVSVNSPSTCGVPVCDIPAKIVELRTATEGVRFEYYSNLFKDTQNVTDQASLLNLLEFGKAAYVLSTEIDTEAWMVNAAAQIANRSTERLLTQPPLESDRLTALYQGIIGESQASSFVALTFWMKQLTDGVVASSKELGELIKFARNARDISTKANHELYVTNLATQIIAIASNRTLRYNPYVEGIYKIKTSCRHSRAPICTQFTNVSIAINDDQHGISVAFTSNNMPSPGYSFAAAEFVNGSSLQNSVNMQNQNAIFTLTVDPKTLEISGVIKTSQVLADIHFTGKKVAGNDRAYDRQPDSRNPKTADLTGNYKGRFILKSEPRYAVTMVLRQLDNNIVATVQGENLRVDFGSGYYIADKGILTLISQNSGLTVKLTLAVSKDRHGKLVLSGTGIGVATAVSYGVELTQQ